MTTTTKATAEDICNHYERLGYQVRIASDHVHIRRDEGAWREAGLVSDYKVYQGHVRVAHRVSNHRKAG